MTYGGVLWLAPLIALQGTPGTGFIRSIFAFIGLVHLFWVLRHHPPIFSPPKKLPESWLLGALALWLILQSSLFSVSALHSLTELAEHFGKILLLIWIAIAFVRRRNGIEFSWMLYGVFGGFFLHTISALTFQGWRYIEIGSLAIGDSFLGNYGYVSPYVTGSLAFLLTDLVARYLGQQRLLNIPTWAVVSALILTLAGQGLLAAKSSAVMSIVLILMAGIAAMGYGHKTHSGKPVLMVCAVLIGTSLAFNAAFSNRWDGATKHLTQAIQQADTKAAFQNTFQGDASYYQRYAWGRSGLEGIAAHPLGYGYGSEGYGKYIFETYAITGAVSSHSGWIDFALDNGIPGLALLLALSAMLVYRGWRAFGQGNPVGLALSLFVVNYIGRCAIDGHLVGSRLTGFAFAAAILWALSVTSDARSPD